MSSGFCIWTHSVKYHLWWHFHLLHCLFVLLMTLFLITSENSCNMIFTSTNHCLHLINYLLKKSHFSLNTNKTNVVSFITINLNYNILIIPTSKCKYLGVSFLHKIKHINGKSKALYSVMKQVAGNLFGCSFRARWIMFLGILHS